MASFASSATTGGARKHVWTNSFSDQYVFLDHFVLRPNFGGDENLFGNQIIWGGELRLA